VGLKDKALEGFEYLSKTFVSLRPIGHKHGWHPPKSGLCHAWWWPSPPRLPLPASQVEPSGLRRFHQVSSTCAQLASFTN